MPGDRFGNSVAIDGDTVVVGAPLVDENGNASGAVYVYHFDGTNWIEQPRLVSSDNMQADLFGNRVAVADGVLLLAAR